MAIALTNDQHYSDIADAIRAKGVSGAFKPAEMATAIADIPTGAGGTIDHGVVFIDYDGTIVESWESEDVADKTALPNNPTREGYTSQGWNWSLNDIKSYIANYPNAKLLVGQLYAWITPDDYTQNTKFYITLTKVTGLNVECIMAGNKTWGDGTSDNATSHTYSDYGSYIIECDGTSIPGHVLDSTGFEQNNTCTMVEIGKNVTSIDDNAFQYCSSLTNITIPNSVTSIGDRAFTGCTALVNVAISNSVTSIGNGAFESCSSLSNVNIPNSVTSIGNGAFYLCAFLTNVTIPNSITSIGAAAFYSCGALSNVSIPNGVTSIGYNAFYSCGALSNVNIPNGVTSIGGDAFTFCNAIVSVAIPNSVTNIDGNAFGYNPSILSYDFTQFTSILTMPMTSIFGGLNGICKIIVPDALYNDWIADTDWSTYADYIYKASEV